MTLERKMYDSPMGSGMGVGGIWMIVVAVVVVLVIAALIKYLRK
jgi:hypothetical protein